MCDEKFLEFTASTYGVFIASVFVKLLEIYSGPGFLCVSVCSIWSCQSMDRVDSSFSQLWLSSSLFSSSKGPSPLSKNNYQEYEFYSLLDQGFFHMMPRRRSGGVTDIWFIYVKQKKRDGLQEKRDGCYIQEVLKLTDPVHAPFIFLHMILACVCADTTLALLSLVVTRI